MIWLLLHFGPDPTCAGGELLWVGDDGIPGILKEARHLIQTERAEHGSLPSGLA